MKAKDILQKFSKGEIDYGTAKAELRELGKYLNDADYDRIESALDTLREVFEVEKGTTSDPIEHYFRPIPQIFNEDYIPILTTCINMIRDEKYPNEVGQWLWDNYGVNGQIQTYFYNEALDIVRLNTLSPEAMGEIGEEYMRMKLAEMDRGFHIMKFPRPPTAEDLLEDPNE